MDFDSLIGRMLPLVEKKIQFAQQMAERELSLRERQEQAKIDLEYRKLDDAMKQTRYAQDWDKEKTGMVLASQLSVEQAKVAGLIDAENIKRYSAKDVADVTAAAHRYSADKTADATLLGAKWGALGKVMDNSTVKVTTKDAEGNPVVTQSPSPGAQELGKTLEGELLGTTPAPPQRSIRGEIDNAVARLTAYRNANDVRGAADYQSILDPEILAGARAKIAAATPPVAAPAPVPGARSIAPAVSPAIPADTPPVAPVVAPARPALSAPEIGSPVTGSPMTAAPVATPAVSTPARPEKMNAAAGPLEGEGKTLFGEKPFGLVGEVFRRGALRAAQERKRREEENPARLGGMFSRS